MPVARWHEPVGSGLDLAALIDVASRLGPVPETELPRPPLPVVTQDGFVVAETTQDGVPRQFGADTDGMYFSLSVGGGGGSPDKPR